MPTYPHGKKWRTIATFNYKQKTKVTKTKREGEIWEAAILGEMAKSEEEKRQEVTFKFVLERYRDEVTPGKRGKHWEFIRVQAYLQSNLPINKPIHEVTSDDLGKWRDERAKTVSPGTILRDFGLLSAIFNHAQKEWKYISENPVKDVKKPREPDHRTTLITRTQIRIILEGLGHKQTGPIKSVYEAVAVLFLVALRTGMRAGELSGLTWDRVKADHCKLLVTKTKARDVPLTDKALRLINRMKGFDKELVFGLKSQTVDAIFRKIRDRAGLKEAFVFHDSRHTAATWLAKQVDVLTLCKIFGWANTSQALTYYNPTASDIAKMLNKRKAI